MIDAAAIPVSEVDWRGARRIIRSVFPPIDLFEDIADPADWPLLIAAEQKTNPRLMETLGNIDLVPARHRVGGPGASYLMAPFTHVSEDRPGRFNRGKWGVLYTGREFETALRETAHHHALFMARTSEAAGWTSQFREIVLNVRAHLHDLLGGKADYAPALDPVDYTAAQALGDQLRTVASNGVVYPSVRHAGGECAGLFFPDLASDAIQGRHLDYHWDGRRVDYFREPATGQVFAIP